MNLQDTQTQNLTSPEAPSGKGASDENFPVGSWLLPAKLRPHVACFYDFARAIDDIADNSDLEPDDKINRLNAMEAALLGEPGFTNGFDKCHALRRSLEATSVTPRHACDLVAAFRQDAVKNRYKNWQELLGYCELSANPVGRYLLDLHGEDTSGYVYSDALCTVLQILNHSQDCGEDYHDLDRVYLSTDWMEEQGVSASDLAGNKLNAGMRVVLDRTLEGVRDLLPQADLLPAALTSRHLAMESAVIVRLAHRLERRLQVGDPLAERVALSKFDFAAAGILGAINGFFAAGSAAPKDQLA